MAYLDPSNLGIIACPGGKSFADQVITHLNQIHKHRFNMKLDSIANSYNIPKEQLLRDVNYYLDVWDSAISPRKDVNSYSPPNFKINCEFSYFMNGEFKTEVKESVRGKDVYIFQDVENHEPIALNDGKNVQVLSVNDHLMSLLVTVDAVHQAGCDLITLVLPVYPYSRQHKKKGRESLTASFLGHVFENLGVRRIITLDIHSREIENAFSRAHVENLHASYQIILELSKIVNLASDKDDFVIVAPDTGAVDRNKFYSAGLKRPLAMIYKERDYSSISQNAKDSNIRTMKLLGDVEGKTVFLADDMLGTGGTLLKAIEFLKERGATKVIAAISLPLFSGNAVEQFNEAYNKGLFYRIIGTNAVYHNELRKCEWFINTDVTGLFANSISYLHHNQSLSKLLDNRSIIEKMIKMST